MMTSEQAEKIITLLEFIVADIKTKNERTEVRVKTFIDGKVVGVRVAQMARAGHVL